MRKDAKGFPIGYKHYYLEVIGEIFNKTYINKKGESVKRTYQRCRCICGKEKDICASQLKPNRIHKTKSCGCKRTELLKPFQFKWKHGATGRDRFLKNKYNITQKDFDILLEKQGGVCAICHNKETYLIYRFLSVDHDHKTGKIRGLLCNTCNRGLGLMGDSLENLEKAVQYLKENK